MNESDINFLLQDDPTQLSENLKSFITRCNAVFSFPSLSESNKRSLVWTSLFQHLNNPQAANIHGLCLHIIRILSRDKVDLDKLVIEDRITTIIIRARLDQPTAFDDIFQHTTSFPNEDIIVEALKCLYNIVLNSDAARSLCAQSCLADGLVCRLRHYRNLPSRNHIMLFDLKILFIMSAYKKDFLIKTKELHGSDHLINCLKTIRATLKSQDSKFFFNDEEVGVLCEILKVLFNLLSGDDPEDRLFLQIMPLLPRLLGAEASTPTRQNELRSNVVNFLTIVPNAHYHLLSPTPSEDSEIAQIMFNGHNMDSMAVLLHVLKRQLEACQDVRSQFESLSAILSVLHKASRGCRVQRKYLRAAVLPPLRDASEPPERGAALRNQLCRLLTTPVTGVRDLVAELLFTLCKEKVSRMVKYTGFGNAAGLLAQRGLLAGGAGGTYSSSSEDSDTEEYKAVEASVDPVVGCTRPKRANPLEGMSEEQKEYEAMELVKMLDRLQSAGVIRPARLGDDLTPQPLDHILQLRDEP